MRALNRLSPAKTKNDAPGKYADGGGLWPHKRADGGAQWFLRMTVYVNRCEMGLGPAKLNTNQPGVTLKELRALADKWRSIAKQGGDPIKERERERKEAARKRHTLSVVAEKTFEARKAELKKDGKAGLWYTPLEFHVLPKLGRTPIDEIDQNDIQRVF